MRNLALFEAYVEYCFAPKHTVGEQLLDVRRDKKERADFAAAEHSDAKTKRRRKAMTSIRTWTSGIASRLRNRTAPVARESTMHSCPRCGASIPSSRTSLGEMVVTALCGSLLLAILIPTALMAEHWIEDAGHRFADQMLWHEPLASRDK